MPAHTPVDAHTDDGATALAIAAAHGQLPAVKDLLARGASPGGVMGDADASLYQAAANGHPAVVRALIAAGADVNSLNAQGRTPLWINAARSPRDDTQIAHSLVNAGAAIERADASGDTPLIAAARADHADLVGFRITGGADAGHRNQGGETALLLAVINNHADSVRQLLVRGADPQTQVNGITPLSAARKRNENENDIARLLRAYGAGG